MLRLSHMQVLAKRAMMAFNVPGLWTAFRLVTMVIFVCHMSHVIACFWSWLGDGVQVVSDGLT